MPLTKIGNESFNIERILKHVEAAAEVAWSGSERTMINLVARLIRLQKQRIQELEARVVFLEREALLLEALLLQDKNRPLEQELTYFKAEHADLLRRWHLIMERTR